MRTLLSTLWLALACSSVHTTLSKSDAKKAASKTLLEKTQFSEKPVQDRGLVVMDLRAEDVVLEHRSYCSAKARERHFAGDVLGYVTPWNSHGYDVAKVFGSKFTHISPVWLQLKRRGREMFEVTGLHDVDQGWLRAVRKQAKGLRIVPRLLFEDWTHEDFRNVLDSEDEIEELGKTMVQVAKSQHFDGFVVEVWSQLLSQKHVGLIHMLTHLAEALHQARLLAILVIPPAVTPGTDQLGMFTHKEFEQLAPVLDGFSLMTYDYPTAQQPGPNAPLSWVRACVQVLDPKSKWRSKILLGLNLYGMDYAASRDAREPVIGASSPHERLLCPERTCPHSVHVDPRGAERTQQKVRSGHPALVPSHTPLRSPQVHPDAEGPQAPDRVGQPGSRAFLRVQEKPRWEAHGFLPNSEVCAGAAGAGPGAGRRSVPVGAGPGPGLLLRPALGLAASRCVLS
uniref:chitinase domain-containing protein 1 isoform X1 n=1 Tax=Halichoerus grypus TaxID=9711 RepID=UPI00165942E8|nr:chitinase domain-containing protein 1 isoform X1 [Halichoerus grypus]XP_035939620.1 chitinase domain-containing protein 1 isoform X1 [Halichoerus grypus]